MKNSIATFLLCLIVGFGYAHETNEAFFKITQRESTVEILAEFPWAIRNALMTFEPQLENATEKADFENAFEAYIKSTLILTDVNGEALRFLEFYEVENDGHSHQNNYMIVFSGNNLNTITNTMMFNAFEKQVNYHTIIIDSEEKTIKTTVAQPSFELDNTQSSETKYWVIMGIALIILLIVGKQKLSS